MSVYIEGVQTPKPGRYEAVIIVLDKSTAEIAISPAENDIGYWKEYPLLPVPEHGRLGDLDDFAKRMKSLVEKAKNDGFDLGAAWYSAFVRHIELTPTIIPADKEEEG